jgi:hypothetical protein
VQNKTLAIREINLTAGNARTNRSASALSVKHRNVATTKATRHQDARFGSAHPITRTDDWSRPAFFADSEKRRMTKFIETQPLMTVVWLEA